MEYYPRRRPFVRHELSELAKARLEQQFGPAPAPQSQADTIKARLAQLAASQKTEVA